MECQQGFHHCSHVEERLCAKGFLNTLMSNKAADSVWCDFLEHHFFTFSRVVFLVFSILPHEISAVLVLMN